MVKNLKPLCIAFSCSLLLSCSGIYEVDEKLRISNAPEQWANDLLTNPVKENWFAELKNQQINQLVDLALNNNFELKQQALSLIHI